MILHDPELKINKEVSYELFNQKWDYCIDGFPKQEKPCIVIIGAPLRKGIPYMGLK